MVYKGNRNSYKYNYVEKIKDLVPAIYVDEDYKNGTVEDITYKVLGKTLLFAHENSFIFDVSGLTEAEVKTYTIPSNKNTNVTPQVFKEHVLDRYGKTFSDFKSPSEFSLFLTETVQPDIACNTPAASFVTSATNTPYTTVSDAGEVHDDLVASLGMMYFLNSSGVAGTSTSLSSTLTPYIVSSVYYGKPFTESTAMQCLFDYTWTGREEATSLNRYLPYEFQTTSSVNSTDKYLSGTQNLDNLKTLIDVWYNAKERQSSFIKDSHDMIDVSGLLPTKSDSAGPLMTFLKAISYSFYDMDTLIEEIGDLMNINECPPEFLDYLAGLIGWKFVGGDVNSWRAQLRQAVYIYKAKGTRQSLFDAIQYVFPREITTFEASSDIHEAYESYLPFLLYYALKTEAPVCQDFNTLAAFISESRENTSLTFNLSPTDHDKNIRFCVDAILEELDREFKFIMINGEHYQTLPNGDGYKHRGDYTVAVPPWERDRFYATSQITKSMLDRLREILSECNEGSRYGISDEFLDDLISFIETSTGIGNTAETFYFGNNTGVKFFTSSLEIAANMDSVIEGGVPEQVEALDYWNSKSSHIFVAVDVGDIDESNGQDAMTPTVITNISRTLHEFTPFHVTPRMFISIDVSDPMTDMVDSVCLSMVYHADDANTTVLDSHSVSGWLGTSGAGDYFSSLDADLLKLGRVLPAPSDSFWTVFGGGLDRDTSRRRDFKYEIPTEGYARTGRSQPKSTYFYGSSTSGLETTKEVIYKGYNFSGQHFMSPESITYSSVYDASNSPVVDDNEIVYSAPSGNVIGVPVSSTMNLRGVEDLGCDSIVPTRHISDGTIFKALLNRILRLGSKDSTLLDFSHENMQGVELGSGIHDVWTDYRRDFDMNLDGSGFYILDHVFGEGLYNASMLVSGIAGTTETASVLAYTDGSNTPLSSVEFSYIIGTDKIKGKAYRTQDDQLVLVDEKGLVWDKGWNTFPHELDNGNLTNDIQLSGIQFSFHPESDTIAIVNYPHIVDKGCGQRRFIDIHGVSFFQGRHGSNATMRYPLIKNKNLVFNQYFEDGLTDWSSSGADVLTFSSTSDVVSDDLNLSGGFYGVQFSGVQYLSSTANEFIRTESVSSLVAGDMYTLSYDVSAEGTNGSIGYTLLNQTAKKYYDSQTLTWEDTVTVNTPAFQADSDWRTISDSVVMDEEFNVDDAYWLTFGLDSASTGGAAEEVNLRNPNMFRTLSNTLFPDENYNLDLTFDSSGHGESNKVAVRIVTGNKRYQGRTDMSDMFVYDFTRNRWQLEGEALSDSYEVELPDGATSVSIPFHTDNLKGPLNPYTRSLYTGRYESVHDDDTYYYIEITPVMRPHTHPSDLNKPSVRVDSVSLTNTGYGDVPEEYTREEVKSILLFLDTLVSTLHSRDSTITALLGLGSDGGSRHVYLERYGGTFAEGDTAGVTYYTI